MKSLLALAAVAVCAGTGWTVYQSSLAAVDSAAAGPEEESLPAVRVEPVRREVVRDRIELFGSLEPRSTVEIRAAVPGYVVKLPVDLGDYVEAGEVIAELDDAEAREVVSRAEAALRVAEARLRAQQATASHARSELERWEELAERGVSTGQQLDAAVAQVAVAESQVELEKAQVEQFKAELDTAKLQLGQTRVLAPASGYVAAKLVSVGHLATPDLPLLRLVSIDTVKTVVHVPEPDYVRIGEGQAATVVVDALPDREFVGQVVRKAPVLDPATRTAAVEIKIPNAETALKPGMSARVAITFGERNTTVVPIAALREDAGGQSLYVVSGDPPVAERVAVEAGVYSGDVVEVRGGVDEGDMVVVLGHDQLGDGGPVQAIRDDKETLVADEARVPDSPGSDPG